MPSPMSFIALPSETAVRILGLVDPLDIRRCQQVCRWFRDLVANDQYLQYILELDVCDYVVPPNPRRDLSYAEKIRALREHRARWEQPGLVKPIFIPHPQGGMTKTCFVDGIFACGFASSGSFGIGVRWYTRVIHFDQLPSWNRGVEHVSWRHDLGFDAECFAIYPQQDLLVLVEGVERESSDESDESVGSDIQQPPNKHVQMHLRTMSSNEPHPELTSSFGSVIDMGPDEHGFSLGAGFSDRTCQMQIYGHLIAVVFNTMVSYSRNHPSISRLSIRIIDWVAGSDVSTIGVKFSDSNMYTFGFLSEEYFILARSPNVRDSPTPNSRAHVPLGYLDIYQLPSRDSSNRPADACCIASFLLPDLKIHQVTGPMKLRRDPSRDVPFPSMHSRHSPRIFQSATQNELLVMQISLSTLDRVLDYGPAGVLDSCELNLYIPTHVLLGILSEILSTGTCPTDQSSPREVPWEVWGGRVYAVWDDEGFRHVRGSTRVWGWRSGTHASLKANDGKLRLVISDFSPNRIRAQQAGGQDENTDPHPIDNGRKSLDATVHQKETVPFSGAIAEGSPPCSETCLEFEWDCENGAVEETLIDDEHVAIRVEKRQDSGTRGMYVYTF